MVEDLGPGIEGGGLDEDAADGSMVLAGCEKR
jgi:hypothetical protein